VYEALYAAAKQSSLNVDGATGETHLIPPFFDAVRQYLDPSFLDAGAGGAGAGTGIGPAAPLPKL
jgi:hypothetical protein